MKHLPAVFALTLTLLFPPLAYAHDEDKNASMQGSPNAAQAPYDIQFLDTMSQHHRDGIKMMNIAVDRAQSAEVKKKAQMMLDHQRKELDELKVLRDKVQPGAPEAINMNFPGMKPMSLKTVSAAAFDHAFLDTTIEHHQGAIEMARAELKSGKAQEVKDKAQMIIDQQTRELAELKQLRDSVAE